MAYKVFSMLGAAEGKVHTLQLLIDLLYLLIYFY